MSRVWWSLIFIAVIGIVIGACGVSATIASSTSDPIVTSTSKYLAGEVVTVNGVTYNCIRYGYGSVGVALWCDRLGPNG